MHLFDRGTRINDRKLVLATRLFRKSQARICGRAKHHNEVSPVHSITRRFNRPHHLVEVPSVDESTISTATSIVASMRKQESSIGSTDDSAALALLGRATSVQFCYLAQIFAVGGHK